MIYFHTFFLSVNLLPHVIDSVKNQSPMDVLGLSLSYNSPSAVELFRVLSQSWLNDFQFFSPNRPVVRLCCSLMFLLNSLLQVTLRRLKVEGKIAATKCFLLEGEMIVQFRSGNMKLNLHLQGQPCWLPFFFPIFVFVMCRDQTVTTDDIIVARCINWSLEKTQCIVPLSFHSLSNTDLLHRRGLLSHVF